MNAHAHAQLSLQLSSRSARESDAPRGQEVQHLRGQEVPGSSAPQGPGSSAPQGTDGRQAQGAGVLQITAREGEGAVEDAGILSVCVRACVRVSVLLQLHEFGKYFPLGGVLCFLE